MDVALEEVGKHCAAELDRYARCVDENPKTWGHSCQEIKAELNACAAKQ